MSSKKALTADRLRELLSYEPDSGVFRWKVDRASHKAKASAGSVAGRKGVRYVVIGIDRKFYRAHRLAFLYMTGNWPDREVDHKDRNGFNNTWSNLRDVTHKENSENLSLSKANKSGHRGVYWDKTNLRWRASIMHNGKSRALGRFATIDEAVAARASAEREVFTRIQGAQ